MRILLSLCMAAALSGCATSSIVVGKVRPATAVSDVKIYAHPPAKYEEIAILESSSETSWAFSAQAKMDAVILNMKTEAARLGANGVLLTSTGSKQDSVSVFVPFATGGGVMAPAGSDYKTGSGMAIFVSQE